MSKEPNLPLGQTRCRPAQPRLPWQQHSRSCRRRPSASQSWRRSWRLSRRRASASHSWRLSWRPLLGRQQPQPPSRSCRRRRSASHSWRLSWRRPLLGRRQPQPPSRSAPQSWGLSWRGLLLGLRQPQPPSRSTSQSWRGAWLQQRPQPQSCSGSMLPPWVLCVTATQSWRLSWGLRGQAVLQAAPQLPLSSPQRLLTAPSSCVPLPPSWKSASARPTPLSGRSGWEGCEPQTLAASPCANLWGEPCWSRLPSAARG